MRLYNKINEGNCNMTDKIPREDLLDEIRRLTDELGTPPKRDEMDDHGKHSPWTYYDRFDGWTDALVEAGVKDEGDTPSTSKTPREDLLDEIRRLAEELDRTPKIKDMRGEHGKYSVSAYYNQFDGWPDAVEEAGFKPGTQGSKASDEELLNELRRFADEYGEPVSAAAMDEHGKYVQQTYIKRFGSWGAAADEAGVESRAATGGIEDEDLIEDMQEAAEHVGEYMTGDEYTEHGMHSASTAKRRFGSWGEALDEAGLPSEPRRDRPPKYSEEELLDELTRLANELDRSPTVEDMDGEHGDYSSLTYINRFGSWNEAKIEAGLETHESIRKSSITSFAGDCTEDFVTPGTETSKPPFDGELRTERKNEYTERVTRDRGHDAHSGKVKEIYGYQCAVCHLSLKAPTENARVPYPLEAAHIEPANPKHGGPDVPKNRILLCQNHHWAFDNGWISLTDEYTILVKQAPECEGYDQLSCFHGEKIVLPDDPEFHPHPRFLEIHRNEHGFDG